MTPENFCYWLQSLFEVAELKQFDEKQTQIVKNHLAMVFKHAIDPALGDPVHLKELLELHERGSEHVSPRHPMEHFDPGGRKLTC